MNLIEHLDLSKKIAVEAGKIILGIYGQDFDVTYKKDQSPLTEADQKANAYIVANLKENFPQISILSEEEKDCLDRLNNDWCFIIDPLDGTKEFIKRNGEFTVNIALAYKQKVVLGVIYAPVLDKLYFAVKGEGAYCISEHGMVKKLQVSDHKENLVAVGSRSHCTEALRVAYQESRKIGKIISRGSSLKGCMIAEAEADLYYRDGYTMEWDTAAMQCIVEEAGGIFRQMDGSEMLYNRPNCLNEKGFYIVNKKENELKL